ncbi:hypothetical protein SLS58_006126 [Diplodia intermedia]|uniref:Uncharacterized protein n=1 Tax=Diplodia intermedia TaxID=856260 RepID=A0ABR3TP83_9PEZI
MPVSEYQEELERQCLALVLDVVPSLAQLGHVFLKVRIWDALVPKKGEYVDPFRMNEYQRAHATVDELAVFAVSRHERKVVNQFPDVTSQTDVPLKVNKQSRRRNKRNPPSDRDEKDIRPHLSEAEVRLMRRLTD